MIEINLIPDVKQDLIRAERTRSTVISISIVAGLAAIGIVLLLLAYVFAVQAIRNAVADESIKTGQVQIGKIEDLPKVLTIQNQLSKISELNDDKKIDSRVFDMLSAVTPPKPNDVQTTSLAIDADESSITIEGVTPTFDSLEVFKKTIAGAVVAFTEDGNEQTVKLASDISTTDVSFGEDPNRKKILRFTLSFVYPEEMFSPKIATPVIKLTNKGNVTDSYLGIPKSLFGAPATDIGGSE